MFSKKRQGFTLIELLVVIAIFALIANVTMISLNKAKRESRDTTRVSDISQLRNALALYLTEKLSFPSGTDIAIGAGGNTALDAAGWNDGSSATEPVFMSTVPRDPSMKARGAVDACTALSTGICDYGYSLLVGNDFEIYFFLEDSVGTMSAGLHRATRDLVQ